MKELKTREKLLKAVIYVAASFIAANSGYAVYLLLSQKVHSLNELIGRNAFSLGVFGASLLLSFYALKKTKAEISLRESQGTDN